MASSAPPKAPEAPPLKDEEVELPDDETVDKEVEVDEDEEYDPMSARCRLRPLLKSERFADVWFQVNPPKPGNTATTSIAAVTSGTATATAAADTTTSSTSSSSSSSSSAKEDSEKDAKETKQSKKSAQEKAELIPAHRTVLAARSPVFSAMFFGKFAEAKERVIAVDDTAPSVFNILLRFIYTDAGKSLIDMDNVGDCLRIAERYQVENMRRACVKILSADLTPANAVQLFEVTGSVGQEYIEAEAEAVFKSKSFLKFSENSIINLVSSPALVINEVDAFKGVLAWGKNRLAKDGTKETPDALKTVLKNILPLIRFPLMDISELATFVAPTQLLPADHLVKMYTYVAQKSFMTFEDDAALEPVSDDDSAEREAKRMAKFTVQQQRVYRDRKKRRDERRKARQAALLARQTKLGFPYPIHERSGSGVKLLYDEKKNNPIRDRAGILAYLGTLGGTTSYQNYAESRRLVTLTSSTTNGQVLMRMADDPGTAGGDFFTQSLANQWVCWDFGATRSVIPTSYAVKAAGNPALRNWEFQGTTTDPTKSGCKWEPLKKHVNDQTLGDYDSTSCKLFKLDKIKKKYRAFRIYSTGVQGQGNQHVGIGRFEIYGYLTGYRKGQTK